MLTGKGLRLMGCTAVCLALLVLGIAGYRILELHRYEVEPGWVTAPGMQGVDVQPFTANMLTPESLSELMVGPDAPIPTAPPAFGTTRDGNLPGPPNAFDENNPLPPPWYPQP